MFVLWLCVHLAGVLMAFRWTSFWAWDWACLQERTEEGKGGKEGREGGREKEVVVGTQPVPG